MHALFSPLVISLSHCLLSLSEVYRCTNAGASAHKRHAYLPTEVLEMIFMHLDVVTLGVVSQVRLERDTETQRDRGEQI